MTEKRCQRENGVSGGARASLMSMKVGASILGVAARVNSIFGCDATLGDVGRTLGALGGLCGGVSGGKGGLWIGEAVGSLVYCIRGKKGCWSGVLVSQNAAVWRCGKVAVAIVIISN